MYIKTIILGILISFLWLITKDKEMTIIDIKEKNIIIGEYFNERVQISKDGKYGYMDKEGKIIVEPIYDQTEAFINYNYALVMKEDKIGVIDRQGKEIITPKYEKIEIIDNHCFKVFKDKKWGIINKNNIVIIPDEYVNIKKLKDGMFYLFDGSNTIKVLDSKLKEKNKIKANDVVSSGENNYIEVLEEKVFIVKNDNKYEITPDIEQIYEENLVKIKNNKYGIETLDGKVLVPYIYDGIFIQNKDNVFVRKNNEYGVIDIGNNLKIEIKYEKISPFYERLAIFEKDANFGMMDETGNQVLKNIYLSVEGIRGNYIIVGLESGMGLVNRYEKTMIPCENDEIKFIGENYFITIKDNNLNILNKNFKKVLEFKLKDVLNLYRGQINTKDKIYLFN